MKKHRSLSILALALVLLLAAVPVFAADPVPGNGETNVIVVNTNQNTGSPAAAVNALYYSAAGVVEYSRPWSINSRGSFDFQASDTPLGDNWEGSMIVQSDQEVAAVAEITWTGGSSADGIMGGAYTGYAVGSTEMYLPYVVYAPDAQFTRVTVQNTEDAAVTISMSYVNRNGVQDFVINDTVEGLGSKTYDMHIPGPKIPDFPTSPYYQDSCTRGPCNWTGGLKITSLNGKEIAAVATNHWRQWAIAYNGLAESDTKVFIPSAERRYDPIQDWRGFSIAIGQCLETSLNCQVQVEYVNKDTGTIDLTLNKTLPPGASLGANTRNGGDWSFSTFAALGDTWAGSILMRTLNNTQIAAMSYSIRPGTTIAGAASGGTVTTAGDETFLPAIYQKGASCPPGNDWDQFSLIRIQNPGTVDANDVDIYYFNRDGSLAFQELNQVVPGEKSFNRNTRQNCDVIPLGLNWEGTMYITSDQPVMAVVETLWGGSRMNSYNGYSVIR